MNLHSKKFLFFVLTLTIFVFSFGRVHAATYTWDGGGGDNNWSTAANWSSDIVPTSTDAVVFNATSVNNSTIDASFGGTVDSGNTPCKTSRSQTEFAS